MGIRKGKGKKAGHGKGIIGRKIRQKKKEREITGDIKEKKRGKRKVRDQRTCAHSKNTYVP